MGQARQGKVDSVRLASLNNSCGLGAWVLSLVVWYLIQVDPGQEKYWLDMQKFDEGDRLEVWVLDQLVCAWKTCLRERFVFSQNRLDPGEAVSPLVSNITNATASRIPKV